VIFAITLTVYPVLCHQETQMLVMMQPEQLTSNQVLALTHRFTTLGLLTLSGTMLITLAAIGVVLRPLQDFTQWVTVSNTGSYQSSFNARHAPSEIKRLAYQWHQMSIQLAAVKHQQRQFTNNLAHELRSPLSLVYGYLQRSLKRSQSLTEAQQESLAMAAAESERMTRLLQDLIELARAESLDLASTQEPLILNEFVRDIADMTERFDHRSIHTEITPLPVRVQTDRDALMQSIHHLIQNAIRYSAPDTAIVVEVNQIRDSAIIQVSDRGEGIPQSQQALIFEPFYRVDPSRTRATGGTGLGLAIVKALAEQMGGTLSIESQCGMGSTFTLTLPILKTQY
jgi:signal transduction histidine kinase